MKRSHVVFCSALAVISLFFGCDLLDPDDSGNAGVTPSAQSLYMVGADTESGALYAMDLEDTAFTAGATQVHNDSYIKSWGGNVYVVERFLKDNISCYNPSSGEIESQTALPDGANPQDLAFVSQDTAYVSCLGSSHLYIINPAAGTIADSIDLSSYAHTAGGATVPYASPMEIVNGNLYVACQRLDASFAPGLPTLVVKIDCSDKTIVDTIPCAGKNAQDMVAVNGKLYICNAGVNFSLTGESTLGDEALEVLDCATGTVTTAASAATLGGEPQVIVHKSGDLFYISTMVTWGNTGVREINASNGTVVDSLDGITDAAGGLFYDAGRSLLFVGEKKTAAPGILVFSENELIAGPLLPDGGLPPYSIAGM